MRPVPGSDPRTQLAFALARHGLDARIIGREQLSVRSRRSVVTIRVDPWAVYWPNGQRIAYTDETQTIIDALCTALTNSDRNIRPGPIYIRPCHPPNPQQRKRPPLRKHGSPRRPETVTDTRPNDDDSDHDQRR